MTSKHWQRLQAPCLYNCLCVFATMFSCDGRWMYVEWTGYPIHIQFVHVHERSTRDSMKPLCAPPHLLAVSVLRGYMYWPDKWQWRMLVYINNCLPAFGFVQSVSGFVIRGRWSRAISGAESLDKTSTPRENRLWRDEVSELNACSAPWRSERQLESTEMDWRKRFLFSSD